MQKAVWTTHFSRTLDGLETMQLHVKRPHSSEIADGLEARPTLYNLQLYTPRPQRRYTDQHTFGGYLYLAS